MIPAGFERSASAVEWTVSDLPERLRIVIVADVSPLHMEGGAERVLWEQASRLARRGHRVRVLSRAPARDAVQADLAHEGVTVRHFAVNGGPGLRFLLDSVRGARRALRAALAEEPADVVHCHQPLSGLGALGLPAAARPPGLYTFHSPAPVEYRLRRGMTSRHRAGLVGCAAQALLWSIECAAVRRAAAVHTLSQFTADLLWRLYRARRDRVTVIPGGADLERFQPAADGAAVRAALGLPPTRPLLLTIRNLEPRMGLDGLIHAMASVRDRVPDVQLLIGGAGILRGTLEALTASLHLEANVRFLGFVPEPDLPRYYAAADAFVLPTRALEGFGLITLEALACGTPVLGTPVGATPEILTALAPGLLFRSARADDMAESIADFLARRRSDPVGYEALRAACRRHAETGYDWEASVSRLETLLRETAETGCAAASPERRP
jgi:glycosyltransferase involved in cell wall biosynthesis